GPRYPASLPPQALGQAPRAPFALPRARGARAPTREYGRDRAQSDRADARRRCESSSLRAARRQSYRSALEAAPQRVLLILAAELFQLQPRPRGAHAPR